MRPSKNTQLQSDPVLKISELYKNYGDVQAVDGISFEIYQGEVFGFLGPNGAGKTTAIQMICGLVPPTGGEITFRTPQPAINRVRPSIGICPQENIYWPRLTCREQLLFIADMHDIPKGVAREKTEVLFSTLGLEDKAGVLASKLSGGMKRRLNICLALIHDPEILVLDEPESGLDPQSRIMVRDFIRSLAKDKTVIITTHNMDEADRLADRVAIIDRGKLLQLDTPDNLKRSIGEGDLLELAIEYPVSVEENLIVAKANQYCDSALMADGNLVVRGTHLVGSLPDIISSLKEVDVDCHEITLRENTLEDVFIHLTGRKLRP